MNELARVVCNTVTGTQDPEDVADLSPLEQAALQDLQSLLQLPPCALAALLSQGQPTGEWMKAPSTPEPARP
jgi:hypothetical protein